MRQRLLVVMFIIFSMTVSPILSWVGEDSVVALCAAPPQKGKAAKKKTAAKPKPKAKPAAKKTTAKPAAKKKAAKPAVKPQTAKANNKKAAPKTAKPILTPEEEAAAYQERVAEVQRYNAKVAAYMNRDISHRLGIWGQAGYSAIIPSAFTYDAATSLGFDPYAIGHVGGGGGLGYQLRYKRFLFTTGAEFQLYNSVTGIQPLTRTFSVAQYPTMQYSYSYTDMRDQWQAGYVQLPLMFGMELDKWYWQAGAKVGLNLIGSSTLNSLLSTSINDVELLDDLQDMYTHALVNNYAIPEHSQTVKFGLNAAVAAEVGLNLDQWIQPKAKRSGKKTKGQLFAESLRYRVALFAEYGVLNIQNVANIPAAGASDMQADYTPILGQTLSQPQDLYEKVAYTSSLATTSARDAKLNPLMVGVKLAVFYELPRQDKKMRPLPIEPRPRMAALVTNAETGKAIAGAQVSIEQPSGKIINKTTNTKGTVMTRLAKGSYRVAAAKLGFFPCDTIDYRHVSDLGDTLRFNLVPVPAPIIYTLCGYVFDSETQMALSETNVRVVSTADSTITYTGTTNEDGLFVTEFLSGEYAVNLAGQGYMPLSENVAFEQDTLRFLMTRIKEGIKVKINHLYFATNKTTILPESEEALSDLADFLRENPTVTIRITGHTDAVCSDAANMKLSLGRAKAVRANLIERGIDADRIEYDGKGKTEPIATNDTEEGRAQNRRVEFEITGTAGEDIQQIY